MAAELVNFLSSRTIDSIRYRFLTNKLHGDEILASDGTVFTEQSDEWLDPADVERLLQEHPYLPMLLAADGLREFTSSPLKSWRTTVEPHYITPEGLPPGEDGLCLMGFRWADSKGEPLLLFLLECY
ncbi:hypothetical protein BWI15_18570 [Kribbella sp. ALI-6-A]|uniref:hypothetical protein n=1 Tax=Kribbella sp. ALI-6-A TaxID=1933817 RepID=UPI00097C6D94|nr:hypothetical protein [Kribbella sp. ALI-6-A]ONI72086.1 hypothetical protein BWI15_18570 [Kribbella sp. ALI-6-A]